jgi:hypothetical protein
MIQCFHYSFLGIFIVLGFILRSFIHFELIYLQGGKYGANFSFLCEYTQFSKQNSLNSQSFLHLIHCNFVKKQIELAAWLCLTCCFHWSSCPFFCQYSSIFVAMTLWCSLISGIVISPALLFLLHLALIIHDLMCFYMNIRVFVLFCFLFFISVRNVLEILVEIALNIYTVFGSKTIFMILIL